MPLKVAIIGRPNVGKSTLFNRLAGRRIAIVDNQPGVTRDRKDAKGNLLGMPLKIVDTAGYDEIYGETLESHMREQTEQAIAIADLALFMIDARAGVTPLDKDFAQTVRKSQTQAVLIANKAEGRAGEQGVLDAWSLGLGDPIAFSAEHGEGLDEVFQAIRLLLGEDEFEKLMNEEEISQISSGHEEILDRLSEIDIEDTSISDDALVAKIKALEGEEDEKSSEDSDNTPIKLAIIGRPNVGKSTLINALVKAERVIVSPEAGTTRDSIDVEWEWDNRRIQLVDTAGLRKKSKVTERLERLSTGATIHALKFAEIVALVMDPRQALEKQDLQIADLTLREGRGLVLVLTMSDMVSSAKGLIQETKERVAKLLPNAGNPPIVLLSGLTGKGLEYLMPAVAKVHANWRAKAKTGDLNRWLRHAVARHPPPSVHGKRIKPRYIAQIKARPPTFVLIASRGERTPEQYRRFLINGLRDSFGFHGTPVRLMIRQGRNPYESRGRRKSVGGKG